MLLQVEQVLEVDHEIFPSLGPLGIIFTQQQAIPIDYKLVRNLEGHAHVLDHLDLPHF